MMGFGLSRMDKNGSIQAMFWKRAQKLGIDWTTGTRGRGMSKVLLDPGLRNVAAFAENWKCGE